MEDTTGKRPRTPGQIAYAERMKAEAQQRREKAPMTTDKSVQPDTVGQEAMVAPQPAPVDVLGKILEAVQGLTSRMERLESTAPQFVPTMADDKPKLETYVPPEELRAGDIRSLTQDG